MKKSLFVCLLLCLASLVFSQSFKIEYIKNPDGTISRGRMDNAKKIGMWTTFDLQGNPKRYEEFTDGIRHGYFVEMDEHGHPFMEGWFNMGTPVGKHTVFGHGVLLKVMDFDSSIVREFYENANMKKIGILKNNVFDGPVKQYYENGTLLSENVYANGKKTGVQKYYFQSGTLQAEYNTLDDNLNGLYKDYYDNGKLATEGLYQNNLKQGLWKEYDLSGKVVKMTKYKNDVEVK